MNKDLLVCFLLFLFILLCASMASATRISIGPGGKVLAEGETWDICSGYSLSVMAIDPIASPKMVWLSFTKDGVQLDDEVVEEGDNYNYEEIFNTKISTIFVGADSTIIRLTDTNISSTSIFVDKKTLVEGKTWDVCGGYSISLVLADLEANPEKAWLSFSKSGVQLDDKVVEEGGVYSYEGIFSTKVDAIFAGATSNIISLKDTFLSPAATSNLTFCTENWGCSEWGSWGECVDGSQSRTRTCFDSSACGTTVLKPSKIDSQGCESEICIENWSCGDWGDCIEGQKIRVCSDSSACGTLDKKPEIEKNCVNEGFIQGVKVSIQEVPGVGTFINVGNVPASTVLKVVVDSSKVFVETSDGKKELMILPEEAVVKAEVVDAGEVKIEEDKGNAVYVVNGVLHKMFMFVFPVTLDVQIKINAETGEIISVKGPWWTFLTQ